MVDLDGFHFPGLPGREDHRAGVFLRTEFKSAFGVQPPPLCRTPIPGTSRSISRYGPYHTDASPQFGTCGRTFHGGASPRVVEGSGGWVVG